MRPFYRSVDLHVLDPGDLDRFLALGWYRMHQYLFTTSHLDYERPCRVHWLRLPVHDFVNTRVHRRIRSKNQTFRTEISPFSGISEQHEELYARYHASTDFDGPESIHWSLFGPEDDGRNIFRTQVISVYHGEQLVAGGYFDLGQEAAASILHFFDPAIRSSSPGKFLMLLTLDYLKSAGYHFYYPGYLVSGKPKMDYKLFPGKEITEYFDPELRLWLPFDERIRLPDTELDLFD